MRFHPTRGAMSMGKSKGGAAPDSTCEEEEDILKDMKRLIPEFHDNTRSDNMLTCTKVLNSQLVWLDNKSTIKFSTVKLQQQ